MAKHKCTGAYCQGNCSRRRNTEKCPKCGLDKLEYRQCYNCEAPTAFISQTGSEQPRAVPMFKKALPRYRRGKPSTFMADELEVEVNDDGKE